MLMAQDSLRTARYGPDDACCTPHPLSSLFTLLAPSSLSGCGLFFLG
jgi:hypothetical protein